MSADEDPGAHKAAVAATATHIRSIVSALRELDFGEAPPAFTACTAFTTCTGFPGEETRDAAV
ncbi:hypothetical protein [Streptomyces orinoci]|uniref:Uncharacterized protein n=1 Tax=Streptomyces orinoci TaxID=67339 RepID=A0ABV3K0M5_STRON|nr:hypothetical protein [Streptomyces orinoci]